jgi:aminoglycoside phosphotransferase (APT) family kinase protein
VNIDAALVRELIAAQFPEWSDLAVRPADFGGWDNRTFRLGEHMSVRLPSAAAYAAQVEKEQRWLPRLGPRLPLPIPLPLAMGTPARGYPWPWSVYRWLEGENAAVGHVADAERFAVTLAHFLVRLQSIDVTGGPPPGAHNFFRGGALTTYDRQTRDAVVTLADTIDAAHATAIWEEALAATWHGPPVWVHGDVSAANLLVDAGQLSAVIDFGCSAVGDPACDLSIAWTFFSARAARRSHRVAHVGAGSRLGTGKALITLAGASTGLRSKQTVPTRHR